MKKTYLFIVGVAVLGLAATVNNTQAGSFSFGISLGGCAPPVAYVPPPPPPVVYYNHGYVAPSFHFGYYKSSRPKVVHHHYSHGHRHGHHHHHKYKKHRHHGVTYYGPHRVHGHWHGHPGKHGHHGRHGHGRSHRGHH